MKDRMKYVWATGSDVGLVREGNEDTVFPEAGGKGEGPLVIGVADGMGGHVGGEVASRIAMDTVVENEGPLEDRVAAANAAVLEQVAKDPSLAGMGTTMSIAEFTKEGIVRIAHVGDSRVYRRREDTLEQLTTDHTFIGELLAAGKITDSEAQRHPKRHFLTRVVGTPWGIEVDAADHDVAVGDRFLICSDGLNELLADEAINALLGAAESPEQAVWELIEAANRAGGVDNTSVAVIDAVE